MSAEPGSKAEIKDTGYTITVLRYVSDFSMDISTRKVISQSTQPNNPAIRVELKNKDGANEIWLFAKHSHVHKRKKIFNLKYQMGIAQSQRFYQ